MVATQGKDPVYAGLPLVYLDHNILDAFLKNKLMRLKDAVTHRFQVVYSNETLEEIKRSGGRSPDFADAFLEMLKQINAAHMSIILDSKFYDTDQVRIIEANPHTMFRQYCESTPTFDGIAESMRQLGFKIAGGRQGETLEDVFQDGVKAFEQLMDYLDKQLDEIETLTPELVALIRKEKMRYIDEFCALSKTSNETMSKHIVDERTWSGIKDFRQHFKIEPHHFNAIKPPNVLEQIWMVLCKSKAMPNAYANIDDFFMFNQSQIVPDMPFRRHQKVLSGYNMLNTIGYYPDKPLYNERGFKRATSDQTHVSLASFCGCLITADERLAKKAEAIYEYLKVPTQVLYFEQIV